MFSCRLFNSLSRSLSPPLFRWCMRFAVALFENFKTNATMLRLYLFDFVIYLNIFSSATDNSQSIDFVLCPSVHDKICYVPFFSLLLLYRFHFSKRLIYTQTQSMARLLLVHTQQNTPKITSVGFTSALCLE